MKDAISLYFIRNGQTEGNIGMQLQGHTDGKLSNIGLQQAEQVGIELKKINITKVYSSPLGRAKYTCEAANLGFQPIYLDILKERDFGSITNLTYFDMINFSPDYRPEGGESLVDMRIRANSLLDKMKNENNVKDNIVIFAHHEIILSCVAAVVEVPLENFRKMMISNCSITQLDYYDDRWVIKRVNELGHLRKLKQTKRVY